MEPKPRQKAEDKGVASLLDMRTKREANMKALLRYNQDTKGESVEHTFSLWDNA